MSSSVNGLALLFGWMILCFAVLVVLTVTPPEEYDYSILSLNDGSQISGSFILGSGSINQFPVFVTYQTLKNGGYRLITIRADQAEIREDATQGDCYVHEKLWVASGTYSVIHVPKGTIIRQYNLDGKL
jgi:hypothetical protein